MMTRLFNRNASLKPFFWVMIWFFVGIYGGGILHSVILISAGVVPFIVYVAGMWLYEAFDFACEPKKDTHQKGRK